MANINKQYSIGIDVGSSQDMTVGYVQTTDMAFGSGLSESNLYNAVQAFKQQHVVYPPAGSYYGEHCIECYEDKMRYSMAEFIRRMEYDPNIKDIKKEKKMANKTLALFESKEEDQQLLEKYDIVNPDGSLTQTCKDVLNRMYFTEKKAEIVARLKVEEEKKTKKS